MDAHSMTKPNALGLLGMGLPTHALRLTHTECQTM